MGSQYSHYGNCFSGAHSLCEIWNLLISIGAAKSSRRWGASIPATETVLAAAPSPAKSAASLFIEAPG